VRREKSLQYRKTKLKPQKEGGPAKPPAPGTLSPSHPSMREKKEGSPVSGTPKSSRKGRRESHPSIPSDRHLSGKKKEGPKRVPPLPPPHSNVGSLFTNTHRFAVPRKAVILSHNPPHGKTVPSQGEGTATDHHPLRGGKKHYPERKRPSIPAPSRPPSPWKKCCLGE